MLWKKKKRTVVDRKRELNRVYVRTKRTNYKLLAFSGSYTSTLPNYSIPTLIRFPIVASVTNYWTCHSTSR